MAFQHPQARRSRAAAVSTYLSDSEDDFVARGVELERSRSRSRSTGSGSGDAVLLFTDDHSDWTSVTSPPAQVRALSSVSSTGGGSTYTASSTDSPRIDHSLLPSHDGNGIFGRVESLRGTSSSSEGGASSIDVVNVTPSLLRARSSSDSSFSHDAQDETDRIQGGWALTEAALSSMTNHSTSKRFRSVHATRNDHDDDDEAELSAGYTSGSDNDMDRSARAGARPDNGRFDRELGQSLAALSAGIGPSSSRRHGHTRAFNTSRSPSTRHRRLPLAPVVGAVERSLSPHSQASSSEGHFSIGSNGQRLKRRHRQAAGREPCEGGSSASHKRFEANKFERIEEEERLRAERMKSVLAERLQENQNERAKNEVLMGDLAAKMMDLDPSTFPLLATTIDDPTPTPSRASSPPLPSISRVARVELFRASFDSVGESYLAAKRLEEEDEVAEELEEDGNVTETECDPPATRTATAPHEWVLSTSPPVFAPRSPPPTALYSGSGSSATIPRAKSPSMVPIPSFAVPASSTRRHRSVSLTSNVSSPLPLSVPSSSHTTHEERVLTPTAAAAAPWGGELDNTFELAMSVWKRFLRRLTRSSSSSSSSSPITPTASLLSPEISSVGLGGSDGRFGFDASAQRRRDAGGSEVSVH